MIDIIYYIYNLLIQIGILYFYYINYMLLDNFIYSWIMLCQHFSLKLLLGIGTNNENEICKVYV